MPDDPNSQSPMITPAALKGQGGRPLAEQYLQRGLNHYDRQEVEAALEAYQQCVRADPAFSLGHNNLSMVLIDLERYEEAVAELYEAIRCDPGYAEAYNNLGFVLRRMQHPMEAASAYTRFLELEPEIEEGPRIKGWIDTVLQEKGLQAIPPFVLPGAPGSEPPPAAVEPPAAIAAPPPPPPLEQAPATPEPEQPPVPGFQPEPPPVEKSAPAAAPPQPAAPAPAQEMPKIKKMSGWEVALLPEAGAPAAPTAAAASPAAPAAEPAAEPAAAPSPVMDAAVSPSQPVATAEEAAALVERGMDQFAEGNLTEAAAVFQQAVDAQPDAAEGYVGLAKVFIRQEKLNEAIELLQKAVQLDPSDPAAYYVLGFALRAVERNMEAAQAYQYFLTLMPDAADAEKMRDWINHVKTIAGRASGVFEEVVDDEQIVTELDKKYKEALIKFQEGDADTALRECIKVLQEDAGHVRTRVLLGRAYLRQKDYDNAIEQLENALVTRPDHTEALYFLGQAAEKRGVPDKALASYKRYLEVAPGGPRAERLRDWLIAHGSPETAAEVGKQAQCELCLRFFLENEITQHEGRATCRNCLAVMGGAPAPTTPELATAAEAPQRIAVPVHVEEPPRRRSKGIVVLGALGALAAAVAVLFYLGKLNPVLEQLGLLKPKPVRPIDPPPQPPQPPQPVFDGAKVKMANEPPAQVWPFAQWRYKPELTGCEDLDKVSPGWAKEFALKDAPGNMAVAPDTGVVSWLPELTDAEALKKGQSFRVGLTVKGVAKEKDAAGVAKELFSVSKSFTLTCQFGYELGPELDLGLEPYARPALAVGDFNGDGLLDTIICSGRFRAGFVRVYLQRKNNPLPPPLELDKGTRFSALYVGDLDGAKGDDVLVADWQRGTLKAYCQGEQGLAPAGEVAVGPGPVALGVGDMDGDKRVEIASLSGITGQLSITTLSPERAFGPVTTVPLPGSGGGATGFVFPWSSAELGPCFLALSPLAQSQFALVPSNNGKWDKGEKAPVASAIAGDGVIAAAAVLRNADGPQRLAVVVAGKESRLLVLEEKQGKFAPVGKPLTLPGFGAGILAHDFNHDGQDDVLVVTLAECVFYFARGAELVPGPRVAASPRLLGPAAAFHAAPADTPELLLLNENRKAQILKVVEAAPPPPEVEELIGPPAPAPAPAAPGPEKVEQGTKKESTGAGAAKPAAR